MHWLLDDVRGNPRVASKVIGVLGEWHEQEEVIAVYPSLSATLQTHRQEIRFNRGDSFGIPIQVQTDRQCKMVQFSIDNCVMKFAAKLGVGHILGDDVRSIGNEGATVVKTTYDNGIEFVDAAKGQALIHIKKADTWNHPLGDSYLWDLELIRATSQVAGLTGTVNVQEGTGVIMGVGTDFPATIGLGDLISVQGKLVQILSRDSEQILQVDFDGWTSQNGLTYELYVGETRTIAAGSWRCIGDVVL